MRDIHPFGVVRCALTALGVSLLAGCGAPLGEGQKIADPTWTITTDPYGGEHACLYIDGEYSSSMYCVPAP